MTSEGRENTAEAQQREIIGTLERLAEHGHAPLYHCSRYAFGNDEKIDLLLRRYLDPGTGSLGRGSSAEKVIRGEAGSGKSHFISQLLERSRELGYVTAMVKLTADANITSYNSILSKVTQELCPPDADHEEKGMRPLFLACLRKLTQQMREQGDDELLRQVLSARAKTLREENFEHSSFGPLAGYAIAAYLEERWDDLDAACRWMSGELDDRALAKRIGMPSYSSRNVDYESKRVLFSIYQFIRRSGYAGTVVGFDETDHGWKQITTKHKQVFLSLLQSDINSLVDSEGLGVMICYSLLPEIYNDMMHYPALQGRLQPPSEEMTFEKGFGNCPVIVISRPSSMPNDEIVRELQQIGYRLTDMLYEAEGEHQKVPREETYAVVRRIAEEVVKQDASTSNRRLAVRQVASLLMELYYKGELRQGADLVPEKEEKWGE